MISGFDFLSVVAEWANQRLADGGPRYAEYHPEQIIVEPWNALSSVTMMLPAVYWLIKDFKTVKQHAFFLFAIMMVFLGGLGSTLFHAFRMSPVFLLLDILPSALLTLSLAIFFWLKILKKWWLVAAVLLPVFASRILLFGQLEGHLAINISYAISGALVLVPLLILLYRTKFEAGLSVLFVLILFALALLFRQLDIHAFEILPQGTHFLWHLFSAGGSYFMLYYLYRLRLFEQKKPEIHPAHKFI